jgi:hypothetical protein
MIIWKGFGRKPHGLMKALAEHLPGGTEENHKKMTVGIASIPAEIRTEHLLNMCQEKFHYIIPFRKSGLFYSVS